MSSRAAWLAAGLVLLTGVIHLVETPEYARESTVLGVLFVVNAIGGVIAAFGIARGQRAGWVLGLLVAGGAFAAYIVSRTVGLPGFQETGLEEALDPSGLLSLAVEGAYVAIAWPVIAGGHDIRPLFASRPGASQPLMSWRGRGRSR